MTEGFQNIHDALEKIAYGEKEHRAFGGRMASPKRGFGTSFRQAVQDGTVRVDTGATNPALNPFTFGRSHAAPGVPRETVGKLLAQLQNDASSSLAEGAMHLHAGRTNAASKALARSAATIGRANHTLVDSQAHYLRPKLQGYASPLRDTPYFPGRSFMASGHEHLVSDKPEAGTLSAIYRKLKGSALAREISSDGHAIDKIVGDFSDKKALRLSDRYGNVYIKKAEKQIMKELGVSKNEASEIVRKALQSEINPADIGAGQVRQDLRTVYGELKHRIKSPTRVLKRLMR